MPTYALTEYKARGDSTVLQDMFMKEPTSKLFSYNRPGGILVLCKITLACLALYCNNHFTTEFKNRQILILD